MDVFRSSTHNLRGLLGICNTIYDPLGISAPFTIKLKLLMKDTLAMEDRPQDVKKDWDKAVPQEIIEGWSQVIEEGIIQDILELSRATKPPLAVKCPKMVGFFDGSSQAFAAVIYIVWMVHKEEPGDLPSSLPAGCPQDTDYEPAIHTFVSNIASAKARVAPIKAGCTVPCSEMSSVVLCRKL